MNHRMQETKSSLKTVISFPIKALQYLLDQVFAFSDSSVMRSPRIVLRAGIALFIILIIWAATFHIDAVIHAQGQVIADSKTQMVQAVDGGVLVDLKVKEGDVVEKGQVIAFLEKERAQATFTESYGKVQALKLTVARLRSEIFETPFVIDKAIQAKFPDLVNTQVNLYKMRRQSYLEQIGVLKDIVDIAEKELELNEPLEKLGDVSATDILRLRRTLNEARGSLANQKNKYFQDASTELNKAEEDLNSQEQTLADRSQILEHTNVVAPAAGIIKAIRVTTVGGVVRQGDEILQILPTESDLIIEAKIKPVDMAYMRVGLPARVKFDAYDYSIFGTMKGTVTYISADALTEDSKNGPFTFYRVKINISEKELSGRNTKDIEVRPGMTATADIKNGDRTVLSFILKPIIKTLKSSLGER